MGFSKTAHAFGTNAERELKTRLEQNLNTELNFSNRYDRYDYYNDDIEVELKSRTCCSTKYDTIMLSKGKIDYARNTDKLYYIFFNFTDKLMKLDYQKHKDKLDELRGKEVQLERGDWCCNVLIPRQLLEEI